MNGFAQVGYGMPASVVVVHHSSQLGASSFVASVCVGGRVYDVMAMYRVALVLVWHSLFALLKMGRKGLFYFTGVPTSNCCSIGPQYSIFDGNWSARAYSICHCHSFHFLNI